MPKETDAYFKPHPDKNLNRVGTFLIKPSMEPLPPGDPKLHQLAVSTGEIVPYKPVPTPRYWTLVNQEGGERGYFENLTTSHTPDFRTKPNGLNKNGERPVTAEGYAAILKDQDIPLPPPEEAWQTDPQLFYMDMWKILVAVQHHFNNEAEQIGQARVSGISIDQPPEIPSVQQIERPQDLQQILVARGINKELLTHLNAWPEWLIQAGKLSVQAMLGMRRVAEQTQERHPWTRPLTSRILRVKEEYPAPPGQLIWSFRTQAVRVERDGKQSIQMDTKQPLDDQNANMLGDNASYFDPQSMTIPSYQSQGAAD